MPAAEGGLGSALVGDKITINNRFVQVTKLLGEGGFSYVYLVKEISDTTGAGGLSQSVHGGGGEAPAQRSGSGSGASGSGRSGSLGNGGRRSLGSGQGEKKEMVLKVTSILSRQQRDIAEKEAKLLSRLSHPSIIKMYDTCYRTVSHASSSRRKGESQQKERPQHLILMELCEGGHALDVCNNLAANGERFDLSTLIIAFGQICNAVSYLHAQRPPIVHRDLKPANFLIKNGAYKLCDFGSAVFGHVDLKTPKARAEAEEVIQKTTTQMFRAPEMVDLYMAKKLTQATDVWALGCCLYSMAFLQNCFEEGSNLAILSRKYKIPDDNPYGEGMVELIDRMLTVDSKARADMTEVILCLSAVYSGRPLPPRKERSSKSKEKKEGSSSKDKDREKDKEKKKERSGTFRTDGQGIYGDDLAIDPNKPKEAKKLDPNSAAARRRAAATDMEFASFHSKFEEVAAQQANQVNPDLAFNADASAFASFETTSAKGDSDHDNGDIFGSFEESGDDVLNAFGDTDKFDAFATFSPDGAQMTKGNTEEDSDNDEDEDGEENGDGKDRPRRRRSGSRRTRTTSSGSDEQTEQDGPHRKPVRRTRSGSRRTSRTGDKKDEGDDLGDAADAVAKDEEVKARRHRTATGSSSRKEKPSSSSRPEGKSRSSRDAGKSSSSRREKESS